ncbi:Homeobox-leucine zipper protein ANTHOCYANINLESS 2 [Morella rubra]|uniref:Homeobox-leucine zipper protein ANTHOCYANINLESS 2 n=1 Tax=Morella rubra TaxID=262757 RepID=A0A6A1WK03_9ROSI|nr:Homeobox-leucine zipper protein ANTHOCYANINLESS 2 [Morella rubra]
MKTKLEGHENRILKQEYDKLKAENDIMKGAMANPVCKNCGAQLFLKFLGRPLSSLATPIPLPSSNSVHGGTERIDYTEQSSPNSPGWKGRMWTDGTKA